MPATTASMPAIAEDLDDHVGEDGVAGHGGDVEWVLDVDQTIEPVVREDLREGLVGSAVEDRQHELGAGCSRMESAMPTDS